MSFFNLKSPFAKTWLTFFFASIPAVFGSVWATIRTTSLMSNVTVAEWAILSVSLTVVGCISQLGLKPGYMQEVTDVGKNNRLSALATATFTLVISGFFGGATLGLIFYILYLFSFWENISAVFLLPLHCILTNAIMMFHTDLRILGKASLLARLSIIQVPVFIFVLELSLLNKLDPLVSFFIAGCSSNFLLLVFLILKSGIHRNNKLNINFIKRSISMGLPVMGSLLSRYSCDMIVVATFRWAVDSQLAGSFGIATRLCEPLMAVYIGSFQMAWGAHIYTWIKKSPSGNLVHIYSRRSWMLFVIGIPVGLITAFLIWTVSFSEGNFDSIVLFIIMLISRILAFGMASSMSYGQTMKRSYKEGFKINIFELLLTLVLVPFTAVYHGASATLLLCALLPWISVFRLRSYSKKVHFEETQL